MTVLTNIAIITISQGSIETRLRYSDIIANFSRSVLVKNIFIIGQYLATRKLVVRFMINGAVLYSK